MGPSGLMGSNNCIFASDVLKQRDDGDLQGGCYTDHAVWHKILHDGPVALEAPTASMNVGRAPPEDMPNDYVDGTSGHPDTFMDHVPAQTRTKIPPADAPDVANAEEFGADPSGGWLSVLVLKFKM